MIGPTPVDPRPQRQAVAMRDGVELATDVHLPEEIDRDLATVLIRLPYDKSAWDMALIAAYLTAHGFAVVAQDVRGKFHAGPRRFRDVVVRHDGGA